MYKKILSARPGRKPCRNDLMKLLSKRWILVSVMKAEKEKKKNYLGNRESLLKSCDSVKKVFVYGGMLEHDYHDTQKV